LKRLLSSKLPKIGDRSDIQAFLQVRGAIIKHLFCPQSRVVPKAGLRPSIRCARVMAANRQHWTCPQ
jgi:hypothetical protein